MNEAGISVVVPLLNERESLPGLHEEIVSALDSLAAPYEVIYVDDGSTDGSFDVVCKLAAGSASTRGIRLRGNCGKSAALLAGFREARHPVIITLDADGQDDPAEIPVLLRRLDEGYDLVSGWKKKRRDPWTRRAASRTFNLVIRRLTGLKLHDINCGFKAYRSEVAGDLHIYGELYRFIPLISYWNNFRVGEAVVEHRPRRYGRSKYRASRYFRSFLDLFTVMLLMRYNQRPAHFFGGVGLASSFTGFCIILYIASLRIKYGNIQARHPLLMLGVLLIIVGIQLISFGVLSELFIRSMARPAPERFIERRTGKGGEEKGPH